MERVEHEEYILGDPVFGITSSLQVADEGKSKNEEKPILKMENLEEKDVLKDLVAQVKPEKEPFYLDTKFLKEEPFNERDPYFLKTSHDVADNKSQTWQHSRLVKPEPVVEILSQHKQTAELCNKLEFCFTSSFINDWSSVIAIEKQQTKKGSVLPLNVKEKPSCDHGTVNHKTPSHKLFSHIPVVDNSSIEEIYVSNVSESIPSSNVPNTNLNRDQTFYESMNQREGEDYEHGTSEAPEHKTLTSPRICSLQTVSGTTVFMKSISSSGVCLNSLTKSNALVSAKKKALNYSGNISSQCLKDNQQYKNHIVRQQTNKQNVIVKSVMLQFKCSLCDKTYNDKSILNKHLNTHGNKNHVCFICCKAYFQKASLDEHMKHKHFGKQSAEFNCSECSKVYNNKNCLRRHQLFKHKSTVDIPSTCDVCQKTFQSKKQMLKHRRFIHSSESEFICGECSKVFNYKGKLVAHIKANHLPPTYKCEKCSALFHTLGQLKSHSHQKHAVVREKSFVCEKCGNSYYTSAQLRTHILCHSEENHFFCEECGKGFNGKTHLIQHLRSHSETRRFSCNLCDKTFKHKHHLKQHMAVHGMVSTLKYGTRGKKVTQHLSDSSNYGSDADEK